MVGLVVVQMGIEGRECDRVTVQREDRQKGC
jgi:hypothetical protein